MCIKNSNSKALVLFLACVLGIVSCRKHHNPEFEEFDASQAFTISSGDMYLSSSGARYATLQAEANSMQYGDYIEFHGFWSASIFLPYNQLIPKYDIYSDFFQFIHIGELQQEATMTFYQVDSGDSNFVFDENFEYYHPYMILLDESDPINSILDTNNWTPITTYYYDSISTLEHSWSTYLTHELGTSFKINDLDAIYCLAREF